MTEESIIIDGRLWQTGAWARGMGRYLLGLVQGMGQQDKPPRIIVLVSDFLPITNEQKDIIKIANPSVEIHSLPIIVGGSQPVEKKNIHTVDQFIKGEGLVGATFIQTSLFTFDYSPFYPTTTINTCIFYDMIPFKFWDMFYTYFPEHEYYSRFRFLYTADKIFAISEGVKNDLVDYLGFKASDVVNIAGADIPTFLINNKLGEYENTREYNYVLLPGGDAPHKNMLRAIRGFDIFNANFGDSYKLIITSFYSPKNQKLMLQASPNIELVGQVSDEELDSLYKHARTVLFPSLDEGLGLPILEAVRYGKKIACSDIATFKELSKNALFFFDPESPEDIARALLETVTADEDLSEKYADVQQRFTWKISAEKLLGSDLKKNAVSLSGRHSIVIEQDRSVDLTKQVALLVSRFARSRHIDLFVDTLDVDNFRTPLIFDHIFKTRDISDAIKKSSKKHRTIIFTKNSIYSQAITKANDEILYVGTTAIKVKKKVQEIFGSNDE